MKQRLSNLNIRKITRNDELENILKDNPFMFHKKKFVISSKFNDGDFNDDNYINQELLLFQDENKKHINSLKNKINRKSFLIEENANNYINYMIKEKNSKNNNIQTEPTINNNRYIRLYKSGIQSLSQNNYELDNNKNNLFLNYNSISTDRKNNLYKNSYQHNSISNIHRINKAVSFDENNFLPKIGSDITNRNYYDKINKQLKIQFNKDYLNYNQFLINSRKNQNNINNIHKIPYIKNNYKELALPPGVISNPNYYNLGESKLSSNPIVSPGNRNPIFNHLNNHKLKSEFAF